MVLGSGDRLGSGVGDLELRQQLCRLGAAAADRRLRRLRLLGPRRGREPDTVRLRSHESIRRLERHFSAYRGAAKLDDIPADDASDAVCGVGRDRQEYRDSRGDNSACGGVRIETRSISVAHTTPHSMSATAGNRGRVSIVAPAREVKAAFAARPQAVSRSAGPSEDKGHKAKVSKDSGHARPESRQGSTVQSAPVKPHEQAGPKTRDTSHGQPQGQAAQGSSTHRQDSSHAPAHVEARSSEPRREAATGQQQKPRPVQAQGAQAGPPKQGKEHAKPVVKEKDKNEEKH